MLTPQSSASLASTPAATNGGGTPAGTYTQVPVQYGDADSDEPFALSVVAGTITGTTPSVRVAVQTQAIGVPTTGASARWATVFTTPTIPSGGTFYQPILAPLCGKVRLVLTYGNADNVAAAPFAAIYSRTRPTADTTPS